MTVTVAVTVTVLCLSLHSTAHPRTLAAIVYANKTFLRAAWCSMTRPSDLMPPWSRRSTGQWEMRRGGEGGGGGGGGGRRGAERLGGGNVVGELRVHQVCHAECFLPVLSRDPCGGNGGWDYQIPKPRPCRVLVQYSND